MLRGYQPYGDVNVHRSMPTLMFTGMPTLMFAGMPTLMFTGNEANVYTF